MRALSSPNLLSLADAPWSQHVRRTHSGLAAHAAQSAPSSHDPSLSSSPPSSPNPQPQGYSKGTTTNPCVLTDDGSVTGMNDAQNGEVDGPPTPNRSVDGDARELWGLGPRGWNSGEVLGAEGTDGVAEEGACYEVVPAY